ncbi:MAG: hypothetical protein ACTIJ6_10990 [Leucobacter sp.]
MVQRQQRMSRAARTARGALFAFVSTVLAAASHAIAGGTITPQAVLVTAVIVLPICVALSGRVASLWRVSLAVGVSQFFYHWVFAGVGASSALSVQNTPLGAHAAHVASLERFAPSVVDSGSAGALMWALHGVAAIVTIALLTRGERAILALRHTIRRALPRPFVLPIIGRRVLVPISHEVSALNDQRRAFSACTLRGPPASV